MNIRKDLLKPSTLLAAGFILLCLAALAVIGWSTLTQKNATTTKAANPTCGQVCANMSVCQYTCSQLGGSPSSCAKICTNSASCYVACNNYTKCGNPSGCGSNGGGGNSGARCPGPNCNTVCKCGYDANGCKQCPTPTPKPQVCSPGEPKDCTTPYGHTCTKYCNDQGTGYGPCECG